MEGAPLPHPLSGFLALPPGLVLLSVLSPDAWLPLLSSMAFWLIASLLVGLLVNHLPLTWLERAGGSRGSARSSRAVQLTASVAPRTPGPPGIRVWKRWIPDAGGALPGGVKKASLVRRDLQSLRRLVLETRRAELVHWLLLLGGMLTALWLPPSGVLVNMLFALAFNLPCLLLQRHNRARLQRCLGRWR